jgi:hypothetical protein
MQHQAKVISTHDCPLSNSIKGARQTKTLQCSDVGFDCAAVVTAEMAAEIAQKVEG